MESGGFKISLNEAAGDGNNFPQSRRLSHIIYDWRLILETNPLRRGTSSFITRPVCWDITRNITGTLKITIYKLSVPDVT